MKTLKDYKITFRQNLTIKDDYAIIHCESGDVLIGIGDLPMLNGFSTINIGKPGYALAQYWDKPHKKTITKSVHRLVLNAPKDKKVDHINRNRLDNRRENLRLVSDLQNSQNTGFRSHNTSGYMGVIWHKQRGKWWARLTYEKKVLSLGLFEDIIDAAMCRYATETQLLGEFAPNG